MKFTELVVICETTDQILPGLEDVAGDSRQEAKSRRERLASEVFQLLKSRGIKDLPKDRILGCLGSSIKRTASEAYADELAEHLKGGATASVILKIRDKVTIKIDVPSTRLSKPYNEFYHFGTVDILKGSNQKYS